MGYNIGKSNSIQFKIEDDKLCFGVAQDDFGFYFGLFKSSDGQGWICPLFGDENGIIVDDLTNEKVMAYGSVANFLKAQFPLMQAKLQRYLGAAYVKPDHANKPECVGYDLALDVDFDPLTYGFSLNKEPPLSHAQ